MNKKLIDIRIKEYPLVVIEFNTAESFIELDIQLLGRISFAISLWRERLK
jgi:hypothetical protein